MEISNKTEEEQKILMQKYLPTGLLLNFDGASNFWKWTLTF